ncbi:MAG: Cd(II)/Pb(II)-responsive transcriptional regulator [Pedobacter sp.]|nr:Cd(II)/Pb(II)-responsive transcriptional regulator [Pedobacter sp.]
MKIGEIASLTKVDTQTLRYYEKIGLLPAPIRMANGYRSYPDHSVERIRFIRHCRELDMSLEEVARILELSSQPDADCDDINRILDRHLEQVREKQQQLAELEAQLQSLRSQCDTHRRAADCGILKDLMQAASGAQCSCHSTTT